jgi:hypothetical protein
VEGKPVTLPLGKDHKGAALHFSIEAGPKGLTLSPSGEMSWTPGSDQIGSHEVSIKVQRGKGLPTLTTATIEVVSAADADAVKGDLSKIDTLHRLPLAGERYQLTDGLGGKSMLLLQGAQLDRLEPDGFTVRETLKLPKAYTIIRERAETFIAVSDVGKCLDVIDKKEMTVLRSVQMEYLNRIDLALHPTKPISFLSVDKPMGDAPRPDILVIDEPTGEVHEYEDFLGRWIRISPDGKRLYAAYRESHGPGRPTLIAARRIHTMPGPSVNSIDLLIVYDISGPEPREVRLKENVGVNAFGIALSADGSRVSFLTFTGYPFGSHNAPGWDTADFTKRPVTYRTGDNGATSTKLTFHPVLPLAMSPTASGAVIFNRETGEPESGRMPSSAAPSSESEKVIDATFSADGRNIILECQDAAAQSHYLKKVKLRLSEAEAEQIMHSDGQKGKPEE